MVLYLSRVAAKQTIGHLVHEVLQQIAQPDPPEEQLEGGSPSYALGTPDGGTPKASRGGGSGVWCVGLQCCQAQAWAGRCDVAM